MKDKEWLKETLKKRMDYWELNVAGEDYGRGRSDETRELLKAIDQLEEPEQKKVVVPQFVADWIERQDDPIFEMCVGYETWGLNGDKGVADFTKKIAKWFDDNAKTYYRACANGYSVEKQKLYRVKVDQGPNYLYVESLHLYSDVIKPLDFNYKFSAKEHALKFASRNQAKGVAELVDGEVEEVTE